MADGVHITIVDGQRASSGNLAMNLSTASIAYRKTGEGDHWESVRPKNA